MTIQEVKNKWWYRIIVVSYWIIVCLSSLSIIALTLSFLSNESVTISIFTLLSGTLTILIVGRLLIWVFYYIVCGQSEIGFINKILNRSLTKEEYKKQLMLWAERAKNNAYIVTNPLN
jgi:uncharacterized membrane protein (DUF106 family)